MSMLYTDGKWNGIVTKHHNISTMQNVIVIMQLDMLDMQNAIVNTQKDMLDMNNDTMKISMLILTRIPFDKSIHALRVPYLK